MRPRTHIPAGLFAAVLFALGTACASSSESEIPEESSGGSPDYASTDDGSGGQSGRQGPPAENSSSSESGNSSSTGDGIPQATGPVAHVDGDPIPAETFNDKIQKFADRGGIRPSMMRRVTGRLVDRLIDQHLIDREIEEAGIEVTDEEVEKRLDRLREKFDKMAKRRGEKRSLEEVAEANGISPEELRNSLQRSVAVEKLAEKRGMKSVSDERVEKFYRDNKSKFQRPEQVKARHILVKVEEGASDEKWKEAKSEIEKIRQKVVDSDESFEKLAKKHSEGASAENGGDLGYIAKEQFNKPFATAAFRQDVGDISQPVRTKFGWHIIKVEDKREATTVAFEKVEPQLRAKLRKKKVDKRLQKIIDRLRDEAKIKKHPDNIE